MGPPQCRPPQEAQLAAPARGRGAVVDVELGEEVAPASGSKLGQQEPHQSHVLEVPAQTLPDADRRNLEAVTRIAGQD